MLQKITLHSHPPSLPFPRGRDVQTLRPAARLQILRSTQETQTTPVTPYPNVLCCSPATPVGAIMWHFSTTPVPAPPAQDAVAVAGMQEGVDHILKGQVVTKSTPGEWGPFVHLHALAWSLSGKQSFKSWAPQDLSSNPIKWCYSSKSLRGARGRNRSFPERDRRRGVGSSVRACEPTAGAGPTAADPVGCRHLGLTGKSFPQSEKNVSKSSSMQDLYVNEAL